jgi:hypothetical protein
VPEKRTAAQNLLEISRLYISEAEDLPEEDEESRFLEAALIPPDLLRMGDVQLEEEKERIRAWALKHNLDISDEQISELANKETFECFARQRRYLQGALQRAKMWQAQKQITRTTTTT